MDYRKDKGAGEKKRETLRKLEIISQIKKRSILGLASTQEGRLFLYFMMKDCGYELSSLVYDKDSSIQHDAVLVNEVLRNYYIGIRSFIPKELLKEIEFLDIDQVVQEQIRKGEKS